MWAEIDLDAITHNLALIRERAGRPVKLLAPVKANAYGHGVVEVSACTCKRLGVDGLATANVDDAVCARRAGVTLPILLYGAQLPGGNALAGRARPHAHRLRPRRRCRPLPQLASASRPIRVHVKVDAGMGRLGVRLDECAAFVARRARHTGRAARGDLHAHPVLRHGRWAVVAPTAAGVHRRSFARVEARARHRDRVRPGGGELGVLQRPPRRRSTRSRPATSRSGCTRSPARRPEAHGFRKALRSLRGALIHIGRRRTRRRPVRAAVRAASTGDATVGVILLGHGQRIPAWPRPASAFVLCRGRRCAVLGVSAEYTVIDVTELADAAVGDTVTVIGDDGGDEIVVEEVAAQHGRAERRLLDGRAEERPVPILR